jgi:hypothetical protein
MACQVCGKEASNLRTHNQDCHSPTLICGRTTLHRNEEDEFVCELCPFKAKRYQLMQNHLRRAHQRSVSKRSAGTSHGLHEMRNANNNPPPLDVEISPASLSQSEPNTVSPPSFDPYDNLEMDVDIAAIPDMDIQNLCDLSKNGVVLPLLETNVTSALEKGKGRDIPLPSPGPSQQLSLSSLPSSPDAASESQPSDPTCGA